MKDVRGVGGTRSEGRMDRRIDGWMHTGIDKGHFYSPPPPTLDDKQNDPWERSKNDLDL